MAALFGVATLPKQAHRLEMLPPYGFAIIGQKIAALTKQGIDIIRLDIGSPDLPPPPHVIEALTKSAQNPANHGYGNYRGDPGFRRAVAAYYQRRFGVILDPDTEVLPLIGSKEGIVNLTMAYIDRGDSVIVPSLNYPAYSGGAHMAGGNLINLPLDKHNGYRPLFDQIQGDLTTAKMLWISYPNNPSAAVAELDVYAEAVSFARAHNLLLCSDNPYAELVYDGFVAPSALQVPGAIENTVEFMSLSKTYNMAGWRLGAVVGNHTALDTLLVVKSNLDSAQFKAVYDAGTSALNDTPDTWIAERNGYYQRRRDRLMDVLPAIGLSAERPKGSMYLWATVEDGDDATYALDALEHARVSVTAGRMYGDDGIGHIRFSLGVPDARFDEALDRLRIWYAGKPHPPTRSPGMEREH